MSFWVLPHGRFIVVARFFTAEVAEIAEPDCATTGLRDHRTTPRGLWSVVSSQWSVVYVLCALCVPCGEEEKGVLSAMSATSAGRKGMDGFSLRSLRSLRWKIWIE